MKYCLDCGDAVNGRADKKFCGDHCRCNYNNSINKTRNDSVKQINRILRKNAGILENLSRQGVEITTIPTLRAIGFDFTFFTHRLSDPAGKVCTFCYDYGYIELEKEKLSIRRAPEGKS
ncbi:hypothetical protein [Pedobacter cryoconitis]|uniref:DUF2116 family Zn-ribbon domain-containing protein n=1 Tax=Pedobacter cryoconitis TaxID=188932 RepID=A0A7X0J5X0_9SPHI|nr:hypothetical protein [Pedobacter cryoconitis]MBB6500427.1 hypothetical protein [Pedobacter cryoconitis]